MFSLQRLLSVAAIVGCLTASNAGAAVIAFDNFETYTPDAILTGNPGNSGLGGNSGFGWTGPWESTNNPDNTGADIIRTVTSSVDGIDGQSLKVSGASNRQNIVERGFPTQDGDLYIGMDYQSNATFANGFFQVYVNDLASNSYAQSYAWGVTRDSSPGPGSFYLRDIIASSTRDDVVGDPQASGQEYRVVFKLSKSTGNPADPYDEMTLWVDSFDENSPTLAHTADLFQSPTVSHVHWRVNMPDGMEDFVMFDNVTVATTLAEAAAGVPEPGALCLCVALGLAGIARNRRVRRS